MLIGITGKPSSGKSTFFSAATLIDVPISPRPFTTIDPNKGVTYVQIDCPCKSLGVHCNPKNGKCENGKRFVPINLLDIAGLVPGAHKGKGLGNRFLDDIRSADVLIQVVDASGKTDSEGNPTDNFDPAEEIIFLEEEISYWIEGIILRGWNKVKGRDIKSLYDILTGLNISESEIERVAKNLSLPLERINWTEEQISLFSRNIKKEVMPIIVAANKIDLPGARENFTRLREKFPDKLIIGTYADGELALRKAAKNNIVKYTPGERSFEIINANDQQKKALEKIKKVLDENGGTGVQEIIDKAVFEFLGLIVVFPVSDEHKYSDNFGNVLPDAILVKKGTTAIQLAGKIHSDLAKTFLYAIDAKRKLRIGKDQILNNGDIIKIVSASK
ncbi:MAG: redox-regulated ATPase YchF [Candidatus Micrarchaeota archaeon]|nr:redox-regulated ATPase YchF [Candidatus Micrarchaeota archaeon]